MLGAREERSMSALAVRVYVFPSHPLVKLVCGRIISSQQDLHLVSAEEPFDVGIFDSADKQADDVLAEAHKSLPKMHPLLMAESIDESQCLRWMIVSGVRGVIAYDELENKLAMVIRHIAQDQIWLPARVAIYGILMEHGAPKSAFPRSLTRTEAQIARLLSVGLSYKEISTMTKTEITTVKSHATRIYSKLRIHSRRELLACSAPG
jgi:DNA-binding NarL/FixJ family response regulator